MEPQTAQAEQKAEPLDQLLAYFARYPLQNLQPRGTTGTVRACISGNALVLNHNERVTRAMFKLCTEGFLGAPVIDERGRYAGTLSMLDLVNFSLDLFGESKRPESGMEEFFQREKSFQTAHVNDVLAKKPSEFDHPVRKNVSVLQAMELFARTYAHRLPVVDADYSILGICTESMIISLLSQALPMLKDVKKQTVASIHSFLNNDVHSILDTAPAIDGFRVLRDKRVTGIPVVNAEGKLVDSLSSRDLRGIGTNGAKLRRLFESVAKFKQDVRKEYQQQTPPTPLTVTAESTLEDVINKLDDGNIHRAFEVDQDGKPVHVISQKDVIAWVLRLSGVIQEGATATPVESKLKGPTVGGGSEAAGTSAAATSQQQQQQTAGSLPVSMSTDEIGAQPSLQPKKAASTSTDQTMASAGKMDTSA